jgi:hypothetical protein
VPGWGRIMVRTLARWACVALAWGVLAFAGGGAWAQVPTGKLPEPQFDGPFGSKLHNQESAKRVFETLNSFAQARGRCDVRAMDAALARLETLSGQLPPFSPGQMVRIPAGAPKYDVPEARAADGSVVRSLIRHLDGLRKDLSDCFKTPNVRAIADKSMADADAAIKKCDLQAYEAAITELNTRSAQIRGQALRGEGRFQGANAEARREGEQEADRLRNLARHLAARQAAAFKDCPPRTRSARAPAPARQAAAPAPAPRPGLGAASAGSLGALIFEAGGFDVSSAVGQVDCPTCGRSGAQSTSASSGFFGADLRLNLFGLLAALNIAPGLVPVPFTESVVFTGPFAGLRLRRYFDYNGNVVAFDFHPGVLDGVNDTSLSYEAFWNAKLYLGAGFMVLNPGLAPVLAAIGVSAYVGLVTESGRLRMTSDESSGGGVANVFQRDLTRDGTAFGFDLDFYFNELPFFIGLGMQWDKLNEKTITGTSGLGFAYAGTLPGQTNFSTAVRIGVPLNPPALASDIRLKRDIELLERRADGIGLYRYRYLWSDTEYVGVMAQEVEKAVPDAVVRGADGFLRVRYDRLGLAMVTWNDWQARQGGHIAAR